MEDYKPAAKFRYKDSQQVRRDKIFMFYVLKTETAYQYFCILWEHAS